MSLKKGWLIISPVILVVLVVIVLINVAHHLERSLNVTEGLGYEPQIAQSVLETHGALQVVDLHADPLLWRRNLLSEHDYGHVDLPRLERGNVAIQVFASVTKSPAGQNYDSNAADSDKITLLSVANLQPPATWFSLYERSIFHAKKLERFAHDSQQRLRIIRNSADVRRVIESRRTSPSPVGALLAVEGLHNLEGKLENLDGLFQAGYRMVGLTHFFDNEVAGSMHGLEKHGLTALGRQVVTRAEELGMLIDLAHSSAATIDDVLEMATQPVVVSHGGVMATCRVNRNLNDQQIREIAAGGGLIGIGFWEAAVCDSSPAGIVTAIDHVRKLVGVEYVGLGSDFDGAVKTQFDVSRLVLLTHEMVKRGFPESDIAAIMGGNAVRLFSEYLPTDPP